MKKVLSVAMLSVALFMNSPMVLACQNYQHTVTTEESYSSSSPVGTFTNYSGENTVPHVQVAGYTPYYGPQPIYSTSVNYNNNLASNTTYSQQAIEVPQSYNKVTKTTYVDTREKADKIIDRGIKVTGAIAVLCTVAGLIFKVF